MLKMEIIGNLGADAVVKGDNGKQFISFNVAHTDKWTDEAGTKHESTQWISCIINDINSKVLPYLVKGKSVYVRGDVRLRAYSSEKERKFVAGATINVREIELIGGQVDSVPSGLADHAGQLYAIYKAYYIDPSIKKKPTELLDNSMNKYSVDKNGFVTRVAADPATQASGSTEPDRRGEDAPTFD